MAAGRRQLPAVTRFFKHDRPFLRAVERRLARQHGAAAQDALGTEQGQDGADDRPRWSETRWLVEDIKRKRGSPSRGRSAPLSRDERRSLVAMMLRITRHNEPIAYVLGHVPFGPLDLVIRAPTLIPRPETEDWTCTLSDQLLSELRNAEAPRAASIRVLDLCCGSGCIGLLLLHNLHRSGFSNARLVLADLKQSALQLAEENTERIAATTGLNQLRNAVTVQHADIMSDEDMKRLTAAGPFDLVVCNPPYIAPQDWQGLEPSVRDWEDADALIGAPKSQRTSPPAGLDGSVSEGLVFYHRLAEIAPSILRQSATHVAPRLVLEVGQGQAAAVKSMFGHTETQVWRDAWGIDRVVTASFASVSTPDKDCR